MREEKYGAQKKRKMQNRMEKCRVRGYTMIIDSNIFRACASFSQRINKIILSLKFNTLDFINSLYCTYVFWITESIFYFVWIGNRKKKVLASIDIGQLNGKQHKISPLHLCLALLNENFEFVCEIFLYTKILLFSSIWSVTRYFLIFFCFIGDCYSHIYVLSFPHWSKKKGKERKKEKMEKFVEYFLIL